MLKIFFFVFYSLRNSASAGIWTWLCFWKCLVSDFDALSLHYKTMSVYSIHFFLDYLNLENNNYSKQEQTSLDFWRCESVQRLPFWTLLFRNVLCAPNSFLYVSVVFYAFLTPSYANYWKLFIKKIAHKLQMNH